jgi:hypothetical protein
MKLLLLLISKFSNKVIIYSRGYNTHIIKKQKHLTISNQYGFDGKNYHVDLHFSTIDRWHDGSTVTNHEKSQMKTATIHYFKKYKVHFL